MEYILFRSLTRCSSSLALSVLALSVLFSSATSAQVFEVDSAVFGQGALTRDTAQGLDFLDLRQTFQRSFQDVSSGLDSEFAGFRYATAAEIMNLVDNYNSSATPSGTPRLTALLDVSFTQVGLDFSPGLSADIGPGGGIQLVSITEGFLANNVNRPPEADVSSFEFTIDRISNTAGSFLVTSSSPVPEPSSVSLCAVLFMGMLARRKK